MPNGGARPLEAVLLFAAYGLLRTGRHAATSGPGWRIAAAWPPVVTAEAVTLTDGKMNAKPQKLVFLRHIARASRAWAERDTPLPRPVAAPVFTNGL